VWENTQGAGSGWRDLQSHFVPCDVRTQAQTTVALADCEPFYSASGNVLVAVNDPNDVSHLQKVMIAVDPKKLDVVVLSVNPHASEEGREDEKLADRVVDDCEARLFSRVVHIAEKLGKRS